MAMTLRVAAVCGLLPALAGAYDGEQDENYESHHPHEDSWWFAAHEKEYENFDEANPTSGSPGPVADMLDEFEIYSSYMFEAVEESEEDGVEKQAKFIETITKAYPDIDWDKPPPQEEGVAIDPGEWEEQYNQESEASKVQQHLGNLFFSTKDKQVAADMLVLFKSLAPKEYIATQRAENEHHNEL